MCWSERLDDDPVPAAVDQRHAPKAPLIVYGATEPTASLSIGDQLIPLEADGEQEHSIRLEFERPTPAARVNRREDAVLEWF